MAINLWPNASFESGVDDWNLSGSLDPIGWSTEQAWDSTHSMKVSGFGQFEGVISDVKSVVSGGTQYTLSMYGYKTGTTQTYALRINDQDGNQISAASTETINTGEWTRFDRTFTTGADDTGIIVWLYANSGGDLGSVYYDGVMLETGASASEWVDYITDDVSILAPSLAMSTVIYNPVVTASTNVWDAGAYIYAAPESGVNVAPPSLQTTIQIHNPVVYAVDVPTAIAPNLMTTQLTMLSPRVSVTTGQSGSKICRFLHLVMGR